MSHTKATIHEGLSALRRHVSSSAKRPIGAMPEDALLLERSISGLVIRLQMLDYARQPLGGAAITGADVWAIDQLIARSPVDVAALRRLRTLLADAAGRAIDFEEDELPL